MTFFEKRFCLCRFVCRVGCMVLIALLMVASGCQVSSTEAKTKIESDAQVRMMPGHLSPAEVERLNRAFADRYVMRLATICDAILEGNSDEAQCRRIRRIRAYGALSMYDIVTDPDPYLQTLNLTVAATLQSIAWSEEGNAQKVFGDRGKVLVTQLKVIQAEAWEIAGKLFSQADLDTLQALLRDWRRKNPDLNRLANARFMDLLTSSEEAGDREKARGIFAQIEQTRQTVDVARAMAERALYLGKRMPLLLSWSAEATLDDLATNPTMAQALADFHTLAQTAERMPATLDAQRKAILADFDQRQPAVDTTVKNVKEALAEARGVTEDAKLLLAELQRTTAAIQDVMKEWDVIAGRYLPASRPAATTLPADGIVSVAAATQGRPFDIQDYAVAMKEASQAARDINAALLSSEKLLDSPSWRQRIDELNAAADGRVRLAAEQSQELVSSVFRRVFIILGALLVVLVLARLISAWILGRTWYQKT